MSWVDGLDAASFALSNNSSNSSSKMARADSNDRDTWSVQTKLCLR